MSVAVLANADKVHANDFRQVCDAVERTATLHSSKWSDPRNFDLTEIEKYPKPDRVVVMGGDGTIISVARKMFLQLPIIGLNYGKLGYLAHFSIEEFLSATQSVLDMEYQPRKLFRADIDRESCGWIINDAVVDIGPPFRTSDFSVYVNGQLFSVVRGDGVIISTPTGSTAYNLSAGGPIVDPQVHAMVITPKNPHRLSIRPVVVSADRRVSVVLESDHEGVYVVLDGQKTCPFNKGQRLTIHGAGENLKLVENPNIGYWQTLTTKLGWGK